MADQRHDDTDYSVIPKAEMVLDHSPSGLLLPGIDATTRREATRLCARDYLEHHVFFNDRGYHNHLVHHLLAVFTMGAPSESLQTIFDQSKPTLRSRDAYNDSVDITADNFKEHLGQERCYASYIHFFRGEFDAAGDDWKARALDYFFDPQVFRLGMDGLFHPFIQVGYGLEFDSKALTAMALAQSCVHRKFYQTLLDESTVADICSGTPINDGPGLSLMQILRAAREDPLAAATVFSEQPFLRTGADHVEKLSAKYANAWDVPATKDAIAAKHAELLSTLALLYGSLTRPGYAPLLHFIVMHSLTSAYFLPIFFDHLSLERQAALLKVHWALDLSVFLLLGAPALHVPPELVSTDTHGVKTGAWASDTNGWLEVFKKAIDSQDSHIPKVIRSLWRGSLLGSFGSQAGSDDGYELPPAINWLYLARRTIDVVTLSSFEEPGPQIEAGRRFWAFGMVGFDEFWATYPRE